MHRFSFETMGTVASIALAQTPEPGVAAELSRELTAICAEVEQRFSLHRRDSELSRINRGELRLTEASGSLRAAYAEAMQWSLATGGAFTPHRPDGALDLNGIVKAQAIADCVELLRAEVSGANVTIGGDGECFGAPDPSRPDQPWRAGIADPHDRQLLLASMDLTPGWQALATSGSSERGDHIWTRPGVRAPLQVSVAAANIVAADVLATAITADPASAGPWCARFDAEFLLMDADGGIHGSGAFAEPSAVRSPGSFST